MGSIQTILVVEDDADQREALAHLLRQNAYSVDVACDGLDALDYLRRSPLLPGLVLLDLKMPRMDGWEFLAAIAADVALRRTRVVITSSEPEAERVAPWPATLFVSKPLRADALLRFIAETLRREPPPPDESTGPTMPTKAERLADADLGDDIDTLGGG